jgi:hypothetical protein
MAAGSSEDGDLDCLFVWSGDGDGFSRVAAIEDADEAVGGGFVEAVGAAGEEGDVVGFVRLADFVPVIDNGDEVVVFPQVVEGGGDEEAVVAGGEIDSWDRLEEGIGSDAVGGGIEGDAKVDRRAAGDGVGDGQVGVVGGEGADVDIAGLRDGDLDGGGVGVVVAVVGVPGEGVGAAEAAIGDVVEAAVCFEGEGAVGLIDHDFGVGGFDVDDFVAVGPFAVFPIARFDVHFAVGQFGDGFDVADAGLLAADGFAADQFAVLELDGPFGEEAGGGEIEGDELLGFRIPHDERLAAVGAVVHGMDRADGFALEGDFPSRNVELRLFGRGVFEFTPPGLADIRGKRGQMLVELGLGCEDRATRDDQGREDNAVAGEATFHENLAAGKGGNRNNLAGGDDRWLLGRAANHRSHL